MRRGQKAVMPIATPATNAPTGRSWQVDEAVKILIAGREVVGKVTAVRDDGTCYAFFGPAFGQVWIAAPTDQPPPAPPSAEEALRAENARLEGENARLTKELEGANRKLTRVEAAVGELAAISTVKEALKEERLEETKES